MHRPLRDPSLSPPADAVHDGDTLLHALIVASPLAIYLLDPTGRVQLWSPAAERLFGWRAEEVLGRENPTVPPEGRVEADRLTEEVLRGEVVAEREVERVRRDGSRVEVGLWAVRLSDGEGRLQGILAMAADITERRRMEAERGRAAREAVRARERMLAVVSHDLRNTLATVLLNASAILETPESWPASPLAREQLRWIAGSAEQMSRLINDLLDVASIEAGRLAVEPTACTVEPLVHETVATFGALAAKQGIRCRAAVAEGVPAAWVDPGRIRQVLGNLLSNAIKFSPPGATVTLRVRVAEGEVCFAVEDTGPGISAEHLPSLFDLYWQQRRERRVGSGLGLAIARGIVEAHGGRIWAESREGEGSTFCFTVPVAVV